MPNRVRMPRRAVRFPVHFWRRGHPEETLQAFVSDVSAGGMFISTHRPLPPHTPVEVEIQNAEGKARVPCEVVHAARIPPLYQRVFKSGMGVRFIRATDEVARRVGSLGVRLPDRGGRRRHPRRGSRDHRAD